MVYPAKEFGCRTTEVKEVGMETGRVEAHHSSLLEIEKGSLSRNREERMELSWISSLQGAKQAAH